VGNTYKLSETVSLLARTPAVLDALLRGLPDIFVLRNEGGKTWNALEVMAHLIHAEHTDWMPRVRMLLEFGESQVFPPFDRLPSGQETRSLAQLLNEFARARSENLAALDALHLSGEDLERRGRHPAFGVVTLSELLSTWAAHDLTHLHQLSRVMAHQYRDAVGPWNAYLGVLHCTGHS
jgi:hypothetical protein